MSPKVSPEKIAQVQQDHDEQHALATKVNMLLTNIAVSQSNAINNLHREQGLKLTSLSLLYDIIERGGSSTQKELADYFPYTKQALTLAVDHLEKEGLVVRDQDQEDRRVKHICITEKGLEMSRQALEIRHGFYEKMEKVISAAEAETLVELLERLDRFYKGGA